MSTHLATVAVVLAAATIASPARGQSTAFSYQGRLTNAGLPAEGLLDFGKLHATAGQRHPEVKVRVDSGLSCSNGSGFVKLSPGQRLTPAPFASHANAAFSLDAADGSPATVVFVRRPCPEALDLEHADNAMQGKGMSGVAKGEHGRCSFGESPLAQRGTGSRSSGSQCEARRRDPDAHTPSQAALLRKEHLHMNRQGNTLWLHAALIVGCSAGSASAQPVRLRLLTHNVFGLDQNECTQRAAAFGSIVAHADPPYDFVGVQEYYGTFDPFGFHVCDSSPLSDAIWCTGRYTDDDNFYRFRPRDDNTFDELFDGGLGVFSMHRICEFYEQRWDYQEEGALMGMVLARVPIPDSTVTLDVYVVHLHSAGDDCDPCCRKQELEELRFYIAAHSGRSGNPVIVMGDFNIGGPPACCGNSGYEDLLTELGNPEDLWLKLSACGNPPIMHCGSPEDCAVEEQTCDCCACAGSPAPSTIACFDPAPSECAESICSTVAHSSDCADCPGSDAAWAGFTFDDSVNELADGQYRIDYIFNITDRALTSSAFDVTAVEVLLANWVGLIEAEDGDIIGNVSDHFGLEATIAVTGTPSVWVDAAQQSEGTGTSCDPFASVNRGVGNVPVGDRVLVRSGIYAELLTINKRVRIESVGGTASIGF